VACAGVALTVAWVPAREGGEAETIAPAPLIERALASGKHCSHCGWIESKRQVASVIALPRAVVFEYTVRMTDGSSSVFEQALPATWRIGERMVLIGGASRPD
jgi:hypothetical protein